MRVALVKRDVLPLVIIPDEQQIQIRGGRNEKQRAVAASGVSRLLSPFANIGFPHFSHWINFLRCRNPRRETNMTAGTMKEMRQATDRSIREIIASARSVRTQSKARVGVRGTLAMSFLSGLLMWLCFTPVNASPLAWLAPVPLLLLVRIEDQTRWMYTAIYVGSLLSQLAMLQWMRLGDPTMYIAWGALSVYLATYTVFFVAISRVAVQRWSVPLVVAGPIVWTGLEFLRAHLLTGFSWYYLGHSQYRWLELIQISDLVGAYGVTFVIMMSAAALALLVPHPWLIRLRLVLPSTGPITASGLTLSQLVQVATAVVVFASTLGYGYVRRSQADFKPGPRVALIQGNFVASLREERVPEEEIYLTHLRLNSRAVREQAQVIIWPEAMFPWPLLSAAENLNDEQLRELVPGVKPEMWRDSTVRSALTEESQRSGAALIMGIKAVEAKADGIREHNSAVFVRPDVGLAGRYDKMHLVPFGEYVPLTDILPVMKAFSPYGDSAGMVPGEAASVFEYGDWRMAPIICFEDTVPHLVRQVVASGSDFDRGKPVDVLVNLTNDGWFHGSSELDQHLITAAFRAVECRTPLVRAVNTGVSAVIDGDGAIREPDVFIDGDARKNADKPPRTTMRDPKTGAWHKQLNAALIHTVPLDARRSLYVRYGDWFALLCAAATLFAAISVCLPGRTARSAI
jgi:apolipoprotein N-acyltransferase